MDTVAFGLSLQGLFVQALLGFRAVDTMLHALI
jgi:hypothetical protein